jgi:hypothetical protein
MPVHSAYRTERVIMTGLATICSYITGGQRYLYRILWCGELDIQDYIRIFVTNVRIRYEDPIICQVILLQ